MISDLMRSEIFNFACSLRRKLCLLYKKRIIRSRDMALIRLAKRKYDAATEILASDNDGVS